MSSNWETKLLSVVNEFPAIVAVLVVVSIVSYFTYHRMNKPSEESDRMNDVANSKLSAGVKHSVPLKNIWGESNKSEHQGIGIIQKVDNDGKPFGSSYYYAHNSLRTTGGYSDGLKMEDYQMETPRLLSKGNIDFRARNTVDPVLRDESAPVAKQAPVVPSVPITKYMWDDPGDHKAIGTIRIEQLDETLSWKDALVDDITLNLKDQLSLTLSILVKNNNKIYRLHIPKLYGKVKEVKKVSKDTRLLIRLYKCKKDASGKKVELDSWPTPYQK